MPHTFVSYHITRKISGYLVQAKQYHTLELDSKFIFYKFCKPRCLACKNIEETDTFSIPATEDSSKTNHHPDYLGFEDKYMFSCI